MASKTRTKLAAFRPTLSPTSLVRSLQLVARGSSRAQPPSRSLLSSSAGCRWTASISNTVCFVTAEALLPGRLDNAMPSFLQSSMLTLLTPTPVFCSSLSRAAASSISSVVIAAWEIIRQLVALGRVSGSPPNVQPGGVGASITR